MGLLPATALTTQTLPVGVALESILLSFALGDRIRTLRRDSRAAEETALLRGLPIKQKPVSL